MDHVVIVFNSASFQGLGPPDARVISRHEHGENQRRRRLSSGGVSNGPQHISANPARPIPPNPPAGVRNSCVLCTCGKGDGSRALIRPTCMILRQHDGYRGAPKGSCLVAKGRLTVVHFKSERRLLAGTSAAMPVAMSIRSAGSDSN